NSARGSPQRLDISRAALAPAHILQLTPSQHYSTLVTITGQQQLACCYRCWVVILDQYISRRDEAARRRVSFQDDHASGPGQAISATTWPNQNLSELRGKNPPVHRREYFQASPPSGRAALTPCAGNVNSRLPTLRP